MAKKIYVLNDKIEPTWDREYTQTDIHSAMGWYNTNKNEKDAAKYLGISDASIAKNFLTLAWGLRMKSRGCKFTEKSEKTLEGMHEMLKERLSAYVIKEQAKSVDNVISIQERVEAKSEAIIGEMEGLVDEFGITGDVSKMNAYQWMVDNSVKSIHANRIAEFFQERLNTLEKNYKDPKLKEYYEGYDKKRFLNLYKCYATIVADAKKLGANAKVARKPRKKKPLSVEKMVKGLNYLQKFDELKLQSIDASNIPGKQQLWVYNVKTRKLGVYNALDGAGLLVKGSSITNFGVNSSQQKTLRKPEKVLKIVTEGGKIALRKVLDDVNSKPNGLTGRINKDTILLRVA